MMEKSFKDKALDVLSETLEIISLHNKQDLKRLRAKKEEEAKFIKDDEFLEFLINVFGSRVKIKCKNGWAIVKIKERVDNGDFKIITQKSGRYFVMYPSRWNTKIYFKLT